MLIIYQLSIMSQQPKNRNQIIQEAINNVGIGKQRQQFQKHFSSNSTILISQSSQIIQEKYDKFQIDQEDLQNYQYIFSSLNKIQSLERTKELLEIEGGQALLNSSSESIYQHRVDKLQKIKAKKEQHKNMLVGIKIQDPEKFQMIMKLIKFWSGLKLIVKDLKVEDFSHKTFIALTKTKTSQLKKLLPTLNRIFKEGLNYKIQIQENSELNYAIYIKQFLIIPRFLISKEKIEHFVQDEETQELFMYLIKTHCLGHYNNQANKKMPDKNTITLLKKILQNNSQQQHHNEQVRSVLKQGKQKFKTICTINHGNKFRKEKGEEEYQMLYHKSLKQLKEVEKNLKKSVKQGKSVNEGSVYSQKEERKQKNNSKSTLSEEEAFLLQLNKLHVSPQTPSEKRKIQSKHSLNQQLNFSIREENQSSKVKKLLSLRQNRLGSEVSSQQYEESQSSFQTHLKGKIVQNIFIIKPKKQELM